MKTYKIVMKDNKGSRHIDAIAASCEGGWRNCTSNYDGENDIGFIDVQDESAEYLEKILEEDENIISYSEE